MRSSVGKSLLFPVLVVVTMLPSQLVFAQTVGVDAVDAIWRVQSLPFAFRGRHVLYACSTFQKKLRSVLEAVGAHSSLIIQTSCSQTALTGRIDARIALATPTPATAENIAAATTFDSKRELIARLKKTPLPTASDIERFRAVHRTVVLENRGGLQLEPSDCELLIAIRDQLFPRLDVVVAKNTAFCSEALARPVLIEVQALIRVRVDDEVDLPDSG